MVPSGGTRDIQRPSAGTRPSGGASQLPSANRPSIGSGTRPSQLPAGGAARPGAGTAGRPSQLPSRPGQSDLGNFLGISAGAGAGAGISQLPARPGGGERPGLGGQSPGAGGRPSIGQLPASGGRPGSGIAQRPGAGHGIANRPAQLPSQRPNWDNWSKGRDNRWNQAVDNRGQFWNDWSGQRGDKINDFRQNQGQRWDNIQNRQDDRQEWFDQAREDRQDWRVDNREDWQDYRKDMWDYRYDRADELWDDVRDYHDDLFDDHWWGGCYWGAGYYPPGYSCPSNPWWWWVPVAWGTLATIVNAAEPVYYDHGVTVIYEGDKVYQNGVPPQPAEQYREQAINLVVNVEQPPPPAPPPTASAAAAAPAPSQPASDWMPLGVWALTQEEKGDATMFFQISVNKEGIISGGYQNVVTGESKPIAGSVDKQSQRAAWRIGDNNNTVFETGLFNLTKDVTTVAMHFGKEQTQTWLMVRLPAPQMPGAPTKVDTTIQREPPPPVAPAPAPAAKK